MPEKPTYEELIKKLEQSESDRKKIRTVLQESQARLKLLYDQAPLAYQSLDEHGNFINVNPLWLETLGYSYEEVIGKPFSNFLHPDWEDHFKQNFSRFKAVGETLGIEFKMVKKDGSLILVSFHGKIEIDEYGNFQQTHCIVQDITARKQAEQAVVESKKEYRATLNDLLIGVVVHASDTSILFSNMEASNILGLTQDQMSGKKAIDPAWKFVHEDLSTMKIDDYPVVIVFSTKKPLHDYILGIIRPDRDYITWVIVNARPVFSNDGELQKIVINFVDITALKQAEAALRESESKYRMLIENLPQKIFYKDKDSVYVACNKNYANDLNIDPNEINGKTDFDFFPKELAEKYRIDDKRIIQSGGTEEIEEHYIHDDKNFIVQTVKTAVPDSKGNNIGLLGIFWDITQQRIMEEQLQQSQKMESIGTLAGGIAHDFNNILGIILGNAELAYEEIPEWNPGKINLKEIRIACLRAKDVVKQLLSFSRKTQQEQQPMKLAPILKESIKLIRASIPTTIDIHQYIPEDCNTILADSTQLHQVIINLCSNASHAMSEKGGLLTVRLENFHYDGESSETFRDLAPGSYVKFSVHDTGEGIEPSIIKKIFDPYFTTKDVDKGTGMGLAVVHGIINNHNGRIFVSSDPGQGSTFTVMFPAIKAETYHKKKEQKKLQGGDERILFVDDEVSLVKMGQAMLKRLGYHVVAKTSPIDALDLILSNPNQFDLVLTDMTMPKMTGAELAKRILEICPDMILILCTGFNENITEETAKQLGFTQYIEKPISKVKLAQAVRESLDKHTHRNK